MIVIREETPEDIADIHRINEAAFEAPEEAKIVDTLRENCPNILSLVAEENTAVVGHILFSPVAEQSVDGMGLAPMAVTPEKQCQGIGSMLVHEGLNILKNRGCPYVIVLGHPEFYPRFGFEPASKHGLRSQWDGVPDEAFMIIVWDQETVEGMSGVVSYRDEFSEAM